jgi:hypothetical protein
MCGLGAGEGNRAFTADGLGLALGLAVAIKAR